MRKISFPEARLGVGVKRRSKSRSKGRSRGFRVIQLERLGVLEAGRISKEVRK